MKSNYIIDEIFSCFCRRYFKKKKLTIPKRTIKTIYRSRNGGFLIQAFNDLKIPLNNNINNNKSHVID